MAEDRMMAARWRAGRAFLDAFGVTGRRAVQRPVASSIATESVGGLALVTPLVDTVGATEIYTTALRLRRMPACFRKAPSIWDVSVHSPVVLDGLDLVTDGERDVEIGSRLARPSWIYFSRAVSAVDESAWRTFRRRAEAAAEEVVSSA